jgi:hypothetical protein
MYGLAGLFLLRCLPEVNFVINLFIVLHRIIIELPWDQPSYQNPEYKRWLDRDYYHNPWKKIDNMILSMNRI